jgi:hypothetical protein
MKTSFVQFGAETGELGTTSSGEQKKLFRWSIFDLIRSIRDQRSQYPPLNSRDQLKIGHFIW